MANCSIEFQDENSIPNPPFALEVVPNLKFQDGAVLARITSTAAMLQVQAPLQLSANFQLLVDDEELDMTQTLNLLMQQLRGTVSLVYKGLADQTPPETDDWTAFTPKVVDEL
jgi:cytochrome c